MAEEYVDDLVARNVETVHLEVLGDSDLSLNIDDALVYVHALCGRLTIEIVDQGKLEINS